MSPAEWEQGHATSGQQRGGSHPCHLPRGSRATRPPASSGCGSRYVAPRRAPRCRQARAPAVSPARSDAQHPDRLPGDDGRTDRHRRVDRLVGAAEPTRVRDRDGAPPGHQPGVRHHAVLHGEHRRAVGHPEVEPAVPGAVGGERCPEQADHAGLGRAGHRHRARAPDRRRGLGRPSDRNRASALGATGPPGSCSEAFAHRGTGATGRAHGRVCTGHHAGGMGRIGPGHCRRRRGTGRGDRSGSGHRCGGRRGRPPRRRHRGGQKDGGRGDDQCGKRGSDHVASVLGPEHGHHQQTEPVDDAPDGRPLWTTVRVPGRTPTLPPGGNVPG